MEVEQVAVRPDVESTRMVAAVRDTKQSRRRSALFNSVGGAMAGRRG